MADTGESRMSGPSERLLIEIFDASYDTVYRFALARCGSATIAEEVASETFVDAARRFSEGRQAEVTEAWLVTVARRRLIDTWRRGERHRRRVRKLAEGHLPAVLLPPEPPDDQVVRALQSLSSSQRTALTLRYLDDLSIGEVADAMGQSYRATESLLRRARQEFADAYNEAEGAP